MDSWVAELLKSCHPTPTIAVTALTTVLFIAADNSWITCLLGALAVLAGQLSIGWSNDLLDRHRDVAAGRDDKPAATGALGVATLRRATVAAAVATVPLSLALGAVAGLAHLLAVGSGWAYNLLIKFTLASPLAYLLAFALLPVVATRATQHPYWPPAWVVAAAALIGAAAHFGNVLPDLGGDLATGVLGLPQRLGFTASLACALVLSGATSAVVLAARPGWLTVAGAVAVAAGLAWAASVSRRQVKATFNAIMLCAALNVALLVATGGLSG